MHHTYRASPQIQWNSYLGWRWVRAGLAVASIQGTMLNSINPSQNNYRRPRRSDLLLSIWNFDLYFYEMLFNNILPQSSFLLKLRVKYFLKDILKASRKSMMGNYKGRHLCHRNSWTALPLDLGEISQPLCQGHTLEDAILSLVCMYPSPWSKE